MITINLERSNYIDLLDALADANDALRFELESNAWFPEDEAKAPMHEKLERNTRLYDLVGKQGMQPGNPNQLELALECP